MNLENNVSECRHFSFCSQLQITLPWESLICSAAQGEPGRFGCCGQAEPMPEEPQAMPAGWHSIPLLAQAFLCCALQETLSHAILQNLSLSILILTGEFSV